MRKVNAIQYKSPEALVHESERRGYQHICVSCRKLNKTCAGIYLGLGDEGKVWCGAREPW